MARNFLTQEQVNDAITEIIAQGETPAVLSIRNITGIGSYTTIKKFLELWNESNKKPENETHSRPSKVELPELLTDSAITLTKKIWKEAGELAKANLDEERKTINKLLADAQKEEQEAINFADKCNDELEKIRIQRSKQQSDFITSVETIKKLSSENIKLETQAQLDKQSIENNKISLEKSEQVIQNLTSSRDQAVELANKILSSSPQNITMSQSDIKTLESTQEQSLIKSESRVQELEEQLKSLLEKFDQLRKEQADTNN